MNVSPAAADAKPVFSSFNCATCGDRVTADALHRCWASFKQTHQERRDIDPIVVDHPCDTALYLSGLVSDNGSPVESPPPVPSSAEPG